MRARIQAWLYLFAGHGGSADSGVTDQSVRTDDAMGGGRGSDAGGRYPVHLGSRADLQLSVCSVLKPLVFAIVTTLMFGARTSQLATLSPEGEKVTGSTALSSSDLVNMRFPHKTSDDVYMDPCKACKLKMLLTLILRIMFHNWSV